MPSGVSKFGNIYMPLKGVIDIDAEVKRLSKEKTNLEKHLSGLDKKLSNENFLSRAKPEVVASEQKRQSELRAKLSQVDGMLADLENV